METITLSGRIDNVRGACPSVSFELKGFVVRSTSATEFQRGPCKDLRDGREVTVFGEKKEQNTVNALKIEIKK